MTNQVFPVFHGGQDAANSSISILSAEWRDPIWLITLVLALLTTTTSVGIAVMSGFERAVTVPEQIACVSLAVAAVIGVHVLPALSRRSSIVTRCCAAVLFAASLLVVLYGQVTFFVTVQRSAGDERENASVAQRVSQPVASGPTRSLMEIASEEEKVRIRLASNDGGACSGDCLTRRKRHDLLEAELDMLMTEEHEAKRREVEDDRQADSSQRLRDSLREDPATARLASLTGADEQTLNMVLALVCAGVLDFTGSFCWYLVLARSRNRAVVKANPEVVLDAPSRRDQTEVDEGATADSSASPIIDAADGRLVQLVHEVAAGNVRPTVDGIREHFNCAQKTANHLRRKYLALCEAIQSTTAQC